jgi:hypothetical protein
MSNSRSVAQRAAARPPSLQTGFVLARQKVEGLSVE